MCPSYPSATSQTASNGWYYAAQLQYNTNMAARSLCSLSELLLRSLLLRYASNDVKFREALYTGPKLARTLLGHIDLVLSKRPQPPLGSCGAARIDTGLATFHPITCKVVTFNYYALVRMRRPPVFGAGRSKEAGTIGVGVGLPVTTTDRVLR